MFHIKWSNFSRLWDIYMLTFMRCIYVSLLKDSDLGWRTGCLNVKVFSVWQYLLPWTFLHEDPQFSLSQIGKHEYMKRNFFSFPFFLIIYVSLEVKFKKKIIQLVIIYSTEKNMICSSCKLSFFYLSCVLFIKTEQRNLQFLLFFF